MSKPMTYASQTPCANNCTSRNKHHIVVGSTICITCYNKNVKKRKIKRESEREINNEQRNA